MKTTTTIFLTAISSALFTSCEKDKTQATIDKFISEKFTEIELKDVKIDKKEMSDRDAFEEVKDYYYEKMQSEKKERDNNPIPETAVIYNVGIEASLKQQNILLDSMAKAKGKRLFTRVIIVRANPDTISHSLLYIDENGNIPIKRLIK